MLIAIQQGRVIGKYRSRKKELKEMVEHKANTNKYWKDYIRIIIKNKPNASDVVPNKKKEISCQIKKILKRKKRKELIVNLQINCNAHQPKNK